MKQKKKSPASSEAVDRTARAKLGYERLRPGQEQVITVLLDGHDTLAVMPTGAGKSAIYQIAGSLIPGATIVVSPLIALQRDQVEAIAEEDMGGAALVNSTLRAAEREEALDEFERAPRSSSFSCRSNSRTRRRSPACKRSIRPSSSSRPTVSATGVMISALTATASPPVQEEIVERLGMHEPRIIVCGFDRTNIRGAEARDRLRRDTEAH